MYSLQRCVHLAAAVAEQRRGGLLDRAVGVDLDEHPLGPALDVDALRDPASSTRAAVGGSLPVSAPFSSRTPSALARERERAGDHQQAIVVARADARAFAVLVAAALRQVADRPVDLVDLVGLTRIGRRRKRQVDVAAELVQHDELVVDAAPLAVGSAVREATSCRG